MNKTELIQTGKNILWFFFYMLMVAISGGLVFYLELNQEHVISDTGVPSNFLDGIFSFFFTCILLIIAIVLWMFRMGGYIHIEGMGKAYRLVNRVLQWIPILFVLATLALLINAIMRFN